MSTTAEQQDEKQERSQKLRQAYGQATTRLRETHREEFDSLYAQEAQALGVDYTPRLSPEQKAEQQLRALLEENPWLADKVDEILGDNQ